jgi:glycosyltransferase involved in cell wall biosynthesis
MVEMSEPLLSMLFITRKYPPSTGGMQRVSHGLAVHLNCTAKVYLIAWGYSQAFLPPFIIWGAIRATAILTRRQQKAEVILLGDALLAPLGLVLKWLFRRPVVVIAHGLDVTYANVLYQFVIPRCLRRLDRVICVSEHTRKQCIQRGVAPARCLVIPNGVCMIPRRWGAAAEARQALTPIVGVELTNRQVLLTVGRLVQRKGVAWFVAAVLPTLIRQYPHLFYIIAGEGPQRSEIRRIVQQYHLYDHVLLVGQVEEQVLHMLYEASEVFIMPNILVENDVEGFGIVALEAGAAGCWVVASRADGIEDAIVDGENGSLVEPGDAEGYIEVICRLLADEELREHLGHRAREFVGRNYSWELIASRYHKVLAEVIGRCHV